MRNSECGIEDRTGLRTRTRTAAWAVAADGFDSAFRIPHSAFRIRPMPDFTYEALAKTGQKTTGTVSANSEREAALMLDGRGLFPLKIVMAKTQAAGGG